MFKVGRFRLLRCIVVGERLVHDVADYPRQGKRLFRNAGRAWELVAQEDVQVLDGVGKK